MDIIKRSQFKGQRQGDESHDRTTVPSVKGHCSGQTARWETDLSNMSVTWSEETHRIFETDAKRFHPSHSKFLEFVHPDDRQKVQNAFFASLMSRETSLVEHRIVMLDGRVKHVEERWNVCHDETGRAVRIIGTCQDITAQIHTEAKLREQALHLRLMLEQFPAVMWTTDIDLVMTSVAGSGLKLLGIEAEGLLGKSITDCYGPDSEITRAHREALHGGAVNYEVEVHGRYLEATVAPFHSTIGDLTGCIGVAKDVTERRQTQQELQRYVSQLRLLTARLQDLREEERTRISREVHDELGQAMTVLRMEVAWLAGKLPSETEVLQAKVHELAQLISAAAEAVGRIATDLRPSILDDLGIVAALESHSAEFERRSGVSCSFQSSNEAIAIDREQATAVFRVFQEALTNVAKHAQATRVVANLSAHSGQLRLTVKDNGVGIRSQQIWGGRSLGLVGMRERAAMLGGSISLAGEPGKGTIMELVLPIHTDK